MSTPNSRRFNGFCSPHLLHEFGHVTYSHYDQHVCFGLVLLEFLHHSVKQLVHAATLLVACEQSMLLLQMYSMLNSLQKHQQV